jgi:hypothetical protein
MARRLVMFGLVAGATVLLAAGVLARIRAADDKPQQADAKAPAGGDKSLEDLLKEGKISYTTLQSGDRVYYKIPIEMSGETTMIYCREIKVGTTNSGSDIKLASFFYFLGQLPKDSKPKPALTKHIAELNDKLIFGGVGLTSDQSITWKTEMWLRGATPATVAWTLQFGHILRGQLKEDLKPFMEE